MNNGWSSGDSKSVHGFTTFKGRDAKEGWEVMTEYIKDKT